MVSRLDHCLNDLLYRYKVGSLPMEPVAIVSNHRDTYRLAASYDIPFHHLPVTAQTKAAQEAKLAALIEETQAELVVLARYMQILSDELADAARGPRDQHPPRAAARRSRARGPITRPTIAA